MGADRKATIEVIADANKAIKSFKDLETRFQRLTAKMAKEIQKVDFDPASKSAVKLREEIEKTGDELVELGDEGDESTGELKAGLDELTKGFASLGGGAGISAAAIAKVAAAIAAAVIAAAAFVAIKLAQKLTEISKAALEVRIQFDAIRGSFKAAEGAGADANKEFAFARALADDLGLEVLSLSESYGKFINSTLRANISLEDSRLIFTGVATAARAVGLSSEDTGLALLAIQQIASRTVVSMEELRGQLGERVSGALNILAENLGITTQKLFKLTEQGELTSAVLPALGEGFLEAFGPAAQAEAQKIAAVIQRVQNRVTLLADEFAKGFSDELADAITRISEVSFDFEDAARIAGVSLGFLLDVAVDLGEFLGGQLNPVIGFTIQQLAFLTNEALRMFKVFSLLVPKAIRTTAAALFALETQVGSQVGSQETLAKTLADVQKSYAEYLKELIKSSAELAEQRRLTEEAAGAIEDLTNAEDGVASAAVRSRLAQEALDKAVAKVTETVAGNREELGKQAEALLAVQEALIAQGAPLAAFQNLGEEAQKLLDTAKDFGIEVPKALEAVAAQALLSSEAMEKLGTDFEKVSDNIVTAAGKVEAALAKAFKTREQKETKAFKNREDEIKSLTEEIEALNAQTIVSPDDINALEVATDRLREVESQRVEQFEDLGDAAVQSAAQQQQALEGVNDLVTTSREQVNELGEAYPQLGKAALSSLESIIRTFEIQNETIGSSGEDVALFADQFENEMGRAQRQGELTLGALEKGFKGTKKGSDELGDSVGDTRTELEQLADAVEIVKKVTKEGFVDGIKGAKEYLKVMTQIVAKFNELKECADEFSKEAA